jgi:membrane-associated PAP2 superfamily phosphatase
VKKSQKMSLVLDIDVKNAGLGVCVPHSSDFLCLVGLYYLLVNNLSWGTALMFVFYMGLCLAFSTRLRGKC